MKVQRALALLFVSALLTASINLYAQDENDKVDEGYSFTTEIDLAATPVKNQYRSGTCWCFASVSFLESELLRMGKGEHDLSEMYFVRKAYEMKAEKYVRMHGKINFEQGGMAFDVLKAWDSFGVLPQEAYAGMMKGDSLPVHGESTAVMKAYVEAVIKNPNKKLSPVWMDGFKGILDAYYGEVPEEFDYRGSTYTPASFATQLELNAKEYVSIGSYTHHPFYEPFIIEIPDNWIWGSIENVKLDEMMATLDHALEEGYTVCWDADVSEKGYAWSKGFALIPSTEVEDLSGLELARWAELSEREKQSLFYDFSSRRVEMEITQENRQEMFDNYQTTDDHLMHITGTAVDQDGKKFYKVKNSWGTGTHIYEGYHYVSEAFMRAKTLFFVLHRDAVPKDLKKKLDF